MNQVYIHGVDSVKRIVNGKVVDEAMVNANYDGSNLDIQTYNKGKRQHIKLDNKDIMKLLSRPASSMSLEKRLMQDFKVKSVMRKKTKSRKMGKKSKKTRRRKSKR